MSRTPKRAVALKVNGSASVRTSPRSAQLRLNSPKCLATASLNTTIDRLGESRQVFNGSLDVSLLDVKSPTPSDSRAWQSPKSIIFFDDLLAGTGVEEALEEAERLRQQNIIIKSAEKKLLWSAKRETKKKAQLDVSVEVTKAIAERRNFSNMSRADAEKLAKQQRDAEAAWREAKLQDSKRLREVKLKEQQERMKDDLNRSVRSTQTANIQWDRQLKAQQQEISRKTDTEMRQDRLETMRILRERKAEQSKEQRETLLREYRSAVSLRLKKIIAETHNSAQSLVAESQKV